jgi:hypothetical protein
MASDPRPIEGAPPEGRHLLGALLAQRRAELGYTYWPAFAKDRLPLTPSGNPNTRLLADIEKAYRDNFPEPRLRQLAQAYRVDYGSLVDVAHMKARALIPLPPAVSAMAPAAAGADPPGWPPERVAADRPFFDPINERRVELASRGIAYPTGAQMFGEGEDAQAWDGDFAPLPVGDKVWAVADMRRRAAARDAGSQANDRGA